ncbi:Crp/Fnr family transcriptional regulator [Terasakiella sp. A23]|uniref:Crp/Fnr family transcriptional regulator n=1 Tax=Terasakiella sp. FCG-A23 TaxID=3080561 RepID=UPI0029535A66|nr:Crp/Fnr family transcriptional regulator [Terasakiella sp. A23]MDV7340215.1 Crp/Fnr family transcriptional regulator [Terasakiella sp. A23]
MSTQNTLSNINLLDGLPEEVIEELNKQCRWKWYDANEQIIDRQAESTDVFFIVDGRVRIVIYTVGGKEITLDDFTEGKQFGEMAAIDGLPRSASVMAVQKSLLAAMPQTRFMALLTGHSIVAERVLKNMAHIIRISNERIMDLSTLGAANRVHAEILRQARDNMTDEDEAFISPIPIHSEIGSRISSTRETVARVMNDLARKGFVERKKNGLVVKNIDELSQMVEEVRGD